LFSKTIDRLLREVGAAHTGRDMLWALGAVSPLPAAEAEAMLDAVKENRESETWKAHDLC